MPNDQPTAPAPPQPPEPQNLGKLPPGLRVRTADLTHPADGTALLRLLDAYACDPLGDGQPLSAEARACLLPALRQVPGVLVLLAEVDHQPVGVAVGFVGFSTFSARGLLNLHDLAVLPDWRGRGVGSRLLAACEAIARARGYCKVTLEVRPDNVAARGLYARHGFGARANRDGAAQYLFLERRLVT